MVTKDDVINKLRDLGYNAENNKGVVLVTLDENITPKSNFGAEFEKISEKVHSMEYDGSFGVTYGTQR